MSRKKEKPAEQKPAEQKPAEQKPAEQKPAEQKPAEQKPAEQKPAEQKPAEQKPAEQKPAEQKPAEQKPSGSISPSDFMAQIEESIAASEPKTDGVGDGENDSDSDSGEPLIKVERKTRRGRKRKKPVQILSGEGLLSLIDMIIPRLISYGVELGTGKSISVTEIQLDEREKRELEKIANEAASRLALSGDPVAVLAIALLTTYGAKTIASSI